MTASVEFRRLIAAKRIDEAIKFCEDRQSDPVIGRYYAYWLDRLRRAPAAGDQDVSLTSILPHARSSWASSIWREIEPVFSSNAYRLPELVRQSDDLAALRASLVASLPFKGEIYLPTAKIPLEDQVHGLNRVAGLTSEANLLVSRLRFEALREAVQRRGCRRVFVIGNGPSLKKTDLTLLRDEVTIGFNGIFLHADFIPTIYVVEDHLVAEDRAREIQAYRCPIKIFPSYLAYCVPPQENTIFLNHRPRISYPVDTDFSDDAGRITYTGGTVTYTGLQIAASLGVEEIVLIGVDASYRVADVERSDNYGTGVLTSKSDDTNHFDPRYFGKGYRWHDPNVHTMLQAYRKARDHARRHQRRIVNATIGGQLEVFPRVDYHSLFRREQVYPRVAIVDFTSIRRLSATGVVKRNLLEGWAKDALLHVHADDPQRVAAFQTIPHDLYASGADDKSIWAAFRALVEFDPQLLYLRPTLDRPAMTIMQLVAAIVLEKPWVIHYMDDWLAKAPGVCGPEMATAYADAMSFLFRDAARVLAISGKMARHLRQQHELPPDRVEVVHNFMHAAAGTRSPRQNRLQRRVIRYFGGMEKDMGVDTLLSFARQIDEINRAGSSPRLELEIFTAPGYRTRYQSVIEPLQGVSLHAQIDDYEQYLQHLADSDLNLLVYNFDEPSVAYVRFSLANKLPELLAAGVPFLAIGHREIGTMELLADAGYPLTLTDPHFHCEPLITRALGPDANWSEEYQKAMAVLQEEFSDPTNRGRLQRVFRSAAGESHRGDQREVLAILRSLAAGAGAVVEKVGDLESLIALVVLPRDVRSMLLARIRTHGLEWSVRDEVAALSKALPNAATLESAGAEVQARAVACLVECLGEARFAGFCGIVRGWLRDRMSVAAEC